MKKTLDPDELRVARKGLSLTQEEAAQRIGVTVRTYQRWEAGEAAPDSKAILASLRRTFKLEAREQGDDPTEIAAPK